MRMFRVDLMTWSQRVRPLKAPVLVVAISALLALLFTIATRPASEQTPHAAGEASLQLIEDEHALVAEFVRGLQDTVKAERLAAVRERSQMRALAIADIKHDVLPAAPSSKVSARAGVTPVPKRMPVVEPPLQLTAAVSQPRTAPRRPVIERARIALSTVQEIPHWVRAGVENAADWAISAPAKAISQLPERRFL